MPKKVILDFECPQFFDFASELDTSSQDDLFFDCKDQQSTAVGGLQNSTPRNCIEEQPMQDENRLLDKLTAALSIIECTPKMKGNTVKGKILTDKFSTNAACPTADKQTAKANTVSALTALAAGHHRSKSIHRLNKIMENDNKPKRAHKRSSSLNDLRTHKKQTFPMTPMCLKRTINRAKGRVVKTTEEMELEEIAKLQKQLKDHLRFNERTLRRLKSKPKPCVFSKNTHAKAENVKENKGLNPLCMEKLSVAVKDNRNNLHALTCAALKNELVKTNAHSTACKTADKVATDGKRAKCPSVASTCSTASTDFSEKNKVQGIKKPVTNKSFRLHSGLTFHESYNKNTLVKPFSFDVKARGKVFSTRDEPKSEVSLSNSTLKNKVDCGKENIPCDGQQASIRKIKEMQNFKCDVVKRHASSRKTAPVRGLLLSENLARK